MKIKLIRKGNYAKPPKLTSKLWAGSLDVQRLRKYIKGLKPRSEKMQNEILELLKDPENKQRIEQTNIEEIIKQAEEIDPKSHYKDILKLLFLKCKILGKEIDINSGENWLNRLNVDWDFYEGNKINYEMLEVFFGLIQHENWNLLGEKGQKTFFEEFEAFWSEFSSTESEMIAFGFLDLIDQELWKRIDYGLKDRIIEEFWQICLEHLEQLKPAELYMNTIQRILRNTKLLVHDFELELTRALGKITEKYKELSEEQEIGFLDEIQENIRDLILVDPEKILKEARMIFSRVTEMEFDSLMVELAKENENLVQMIAEKLFGKEEAA